jgi:hypothetical protein
LECPEQSLPDEGMSSKVEAFTNGEIMFRIVFDRGQRFIDLAKTKTGNWTDVFTLAARMSPPYQPKTGSFSEAVKLLDQHWTEVVAQL